MRTSTLKIVTVMGLVVGFVGFHGPGCADNAQNGAQTGDGGTLKGMCTPAEDDGNPCTAEGCKGAMVEHVPLVGASCGAGLACNAQGKCAPICKSAVDCGVANECVTWSCTDSICSSMFTQKGTPLTAVEKQKLQDCAVDTCDGVGIEEVVLDPMDKPADTDCTQWTCDQVSIPPSSLQVPSGQHCIIQKSKVCDANGNCVQCTSNNDCGGAPSYCHNNQCFRCDDNIENGDETGTDCGGSCKACKGSMCSNPGDCKSAHCADGICCESDCTMPCFACNIMSSLGSCIPLQQAGSKDTCGENQACSAVGVCIDGTANGVQCSMDMNCVTNLCQVGKCAVCTMDTDCHGNKKCSKNGICM